MAAMNIAASHPEAIAQVGAAMEQVCAILVCVHTSTEIDSFDGRDLVGPERAPKFFTVREKKHCASKHHLEFVWKNSKLMFLP